jgi:hypothetical protein
MTETLFTPGEWRVEQGTTLVWGACNADDHTSRGMGYPIAECRITPTAKWAKRPDEAEGIANAHLIAASPDGYAFAEKAAHFLTGLHLGRPLSTDDVEELLAEAKAYLSKARGESSHV